MDDHQIRLAREIRRLKLYSIGSTLVFLLVLLAGFQSFEQKQRFTEIDVERINVVEPDGRLALVLANRARLPGVIEDGKEWNDREGIAGLLFYDAKGGEAGGLTYGSEESDSAHEAFTHLSFDKYGADQVVVLNYNESPGKEFAGLRVVDRSSELTSRRVRELRQEARSGTEAERRSAEQRLRELTA